jgi:hypothetical protein
MEQQRKEIDLEQVKSLMDKQYRLIHVDYDENLDGNAPVIRRCIEEKSANILYDLFDKWYLESEFDALDRAFDDLKQHLAGKGYTNRQIARFLEKHMQDVRDEIYNRIKVDVLDIIAEEFETKKDLPGFKELLAERNGDDNKDNDDDGENDDDKND